MSILSDWFFHDTIKLYTGVFGTLFNDLKLKRGSKFIKVPISYTIRQKYDVRNTENPDPNALRYKSQLPRFGYRLTSIQRDPERVLNKMQILQERNVDRTAADGVNTQYNRVPHKFTYELYIKTKNIEDMSQLLEQILVVFNPSINVIVNDNADLQSETSVNVKLIDNGLSNIVDESFEDEQVFETTLTFELEGYLYMQTNLTKIIKIVNINFRELGLEAPENLLETITETA